MKFLRDFAIFTLVVPGSAVAWWVTLDKHGLDFFKIAELMPVSEELGVA